MALWDLHRLCKAYGQRPSTVFGIEDEWLAWDFDHAVSALGWEVEQRMQEKRKDGTPKYRSIYALLNMRKPMVMKPISRSTLMMLAGEHGS